MINSGRPSLDSIEPGPGSLNPDTQMPSGAPGIRSGPIRLLRSEGATITPDTHMPPADWLTYYYYFSWQLFTIFFLFFSQFWFCFILAFRLNSFGGAYIYLFIYLVVAFVFLDVRAFLMEIKRNLIESEIITPPRGSPTHSLCDLRSQMCWWCTRLAHHQIHRIPRITSNPQISTKIAPGLISDWRLLIKNCAALRCTNKISRQAIHIYFIFWWAWA